MNCARSVPKAYPSPNMTRIVPKVTPNTRSADGLVFMRRIKKWLKIPAPPVIALLEREAPVILSPMVELIDLFSVL